VSINLKHATDLSLSSHRETLAFSLDDLSKKIMSLEAAPALEDVKVWLSDVRIDEAGLRPFVAFKPSTYARRHVCRNEFAEMLVLCWRPGQRTPIHDHNGSYGAVRVCQGIMWETIFAFEGSDKLSYVSGREWTSGFVTGADVPDIHQIGNPEISGQDLVTIHLYAPPLGVLNTYKVGSSQVGHYTPGEFMDGGGI
jgi:cysteine dioxygenase